MKNGYWHIYELKGVCDSCFLIVPLTTLSLQIQFNSENCIYHLVFAFISRTFSSHSLHSAHHIHYALHQQHTIHWAQRTAYFPFPGHHKILMFYLELREFTDYKVTIFIIHCFYINDTLNSSFCMSFFIFYPYTLGKEHLKITLISPNFNNLKKAWNE